MTEYQVMATYAGFALIVFFSAIVWSKVRESLKKRFHLLNYDSKEEFKTPHAP